MLRKVLSLAAAFSLAALVSCTSIPAPITSGANHAADTQTVTLAGTVHPLTQGAIDEGPVNPAIELDSMVLLLQVSPAQQAALDALTQAQQDPTSPLYHQWLTPAGFGAQFGVSDAQLAQVTAWLEAQGFTVDEVPSGRRLVIFSGTAGEVLDAFHTEMHRYRVGNAVHIANAQEMQTPADLAEVIGGVLSLDDFRRVSEIRAIRTLDAQPQYTAGATHYLFPADFATIYDLSPLYSAGTTGSGSRIAIAGRSNINLSDVAAFRSMAGLAASELTVTVTGIDPGLVANDQVESTLDVEWSGAIAPDATVNLVIAASTATTDGVDLAAAYIVNRAAAPIVNLSYGSCEQDMSAAELAFYNGLWQQAASQGMSVFVASGDAGAAGCQSGSGTVGSRAAVNGLCTSPYATCVGGTEFNESANAAQYWATTNSAPYGSALGYIPEKVWNESALAGGAGLWASGGGASTVYPQPAWQALARGAAAANQMRAVPDVSLAAADHDGYFMVENGSYQIVSGTSVASTAFAGIMALVVSKQDGAAQGNANNGFYALAGTASNPFRTTPSGNNSVSGVEGYAADGAEYNLATGLGSVDGALLAKAWGAAAGNAPIIPRNNGCSRFSLLPRECLPTPRLPVP